ncbi:MAG: hypothetical protein RLZZ206_1973 [Cyanobacteriota bacterium]|jgi:hypothetical protein
MTAMVYAAVVSNSYGQFDPIVRDLGPALGPEGLAHLRLRLEILRQRSSGNTTAKAQPDWVVSLAMLDIADALGDAEAYLAEYRDHHPEALMVPAIIATDGLLVEDTELNSRLMKAIRELYRGRESVLLMDVASPILVRSLNKFSQISSYSRIIATTGLIPNRGSRKGD